MEFALKKMKKALNISAGRFYPSNRSQWKFTMESKKELSIENKLNYRSSVIKRFVVGSTETYLYSYQHRIVGIVST